MQIVGVWPPSSQPVGMVVAVAEEVRPVKDLPQTLFLIALLAFGASLGATRFGFLGFVLGVIAALVFGGTVIHYLERS